MSQRSGAGNRAVAGGPTTATPGRAELLDRKRRLMADYIVAGEDLLQRLSAPAVATGTADGLPAPEDLTPSLDRREGIIAEMRKLDRALDATRGADRAAEIVAENALRRTIECVASQDRHLADALDLWQARIAASLADLSTGRKTLKAYGAADDPEALRRVIDEAA